MRRRKKHDSRDFFFKSHGSEIESVPFVFPNAFDFGVPKSSLFHLFFQMALILGFSVQSTVSKLYTSSSIF